MLVGVHAATSGCLRLEVKVSEVAGDKLGFPRKLTRLGQVTDCGPLQFVSQLTLHTLRP